MTLESLGIDRSHLIAAATRLTRYNERTAARIMTSRQVPLERRIVFIRQVEALLDRRR
jgi:hypothetical protein